MDITEMQNRLSLIERHEQKLIEACGKMLVAGNRKLYTLDFLFVGAIHRFVKLSMGIRAHIEQRNFTCAAPLVRLMLDSLFRLYAASLVDDKDAFFLTLIQGRAINKLKDRDGQLMHDKYLVGKLVEVTKMPELQVLYNKTSGFVHFSENHLFAAAREIDGKHQFAIGGPDDYFSSTAYEEVTTAVHDLYGILFVFLAHWINEKDPDNKVEVAFTELNVT